MLTIYIISVIFVIGMALSEFYTNSEKFEEIKMHEDMTHNGFVLASIFIIFCPLVNTTLMILRIFEWIKEKVNDE